MLKYPGDWKFEEIGFGIPAEALNEFRDLIIDIAQNSKARIEEFKSAFGEPYPSSSFDWALTDLWSAMESKSNKAAAFVDALWTGIDAARQKDVPVPSHYTINKLLAKYDIPLEIDPPELRRTSSAVIVIPESATEHGINSGQVSAFLLGDQIRSGGYGVVYKAKRVTNVASFEFAVKILDPSPFVQDHQKALLRFKREIEALQTLQHRSIVQLVEAGITVDNKQYIAMPFIDGVDLLTAARATNLDGVIAMFVEILVALQYAHQKTVIHRDLKPTNIIVRSSDGQPIILDFGCAYLLDDMDSKGYTTHAVGTLGYIPSEVQAEPKCRSHLHDVYACGVMLYEALAGRRPDPSNYVPLSSVNPDYEVLDGIVKNAVAGVASRTASAQEFANQLADCRKT